LTWQIEIVKSKCKKLRVDPLDKYPPLQVEIYVVGQKAEMAENKMKMLEVESSSSFFGVECMALDK
jgi:hypothetical protein